MPRPSVTGEKHPGLPVQSDSAAHINGNKICSQGQRQLISGTRSYLALVVFTSASGELLLGLTCRPHQQPALRLILEGIRCVILIKRRISAHWPSICLVRWDGRGWVRRRERGVDSAFPHSAQSFDQCFSTPGHFVPQGLFAMSGDVFGCHSLGALLTSSW